MSKGFTATWLGDTDPNAQIIWMGDLRFVKGDAVSVPADHEFADRIKDNPVFSTEGKAEPVPAAEPDEDAQMIEAEKGTEKGALKAQLRARGVDVKGNPRVETLRKKLIEATDGETTAPDATIPQPATGR